MSTGVRSHESYYLTCVMLVVAYAVAARLRDRKTTPSNSQATSRLLQCVCVLGLACEDSGTKGRRKMKRHRKMSHPRQDIALAPTNCLGPSGAEILAFFCENPRAVCTATAVA